MTTPTTHFVANGKIRTAYYDEGSGPVLMLVHGFTGSKMDFHDELPFLSQHYRVIVPDHRGHGESSNDGPYTLAQLVEDLHGLVNALSLTNLHLLGHSLGGMAAMRYAIGHQDTLASLILMDTSAEPFGMRADYFDSVLGLLQQADGRQQLVEMMKTMPRIPEVDNGIQKIGEQEHWQRVLTKFEQMDVAAYESFANELADLPDIVSNLASINVPTTVMVGEADKPFVGPSDNMVKSLPNAALVTIAAASHCPQYENRDAWFTCVSDHLARHA